ncbi:MAG: DUF4350 domain-containing protein [Acidobacteriaceae bacterium]|nr:DUF4350 domain-containing protein [Acidobacteriaceae bacterium]
MAATVVATVLLRAGITYNYPAYSSLNNSADGAKAYYEALRKLGVDTTRNYRPLRKLTGTRADVFYAGTPISALQHADEKDFEDFEHLAKTGAHLILAAQPEVVGTEPSRISKKKEKKEDAAPKDLLKQRWGIELGFRPRQLTAAETGPLKHLGIKPFVAYFRTWSNEWTPSVTRNGQPAILERRFGSGSILLVSDCRYFSNRQLLTSPDTEILTAVISQTPQVIFDESHLGLEDTGTVIGLTTAHHLNWIFAGFVLLAGLYIWRYSVSFIPPFPAPTSSSVAGRDAYAALTNLLIQSVPLKSLLHTAAEEWNRTAHLRRNQRPISEDEISLLPDIDRATTMAEYKSICQRMKDRI